MMTIYQRVLLLERGPDPWQVCLRPAGSVWVLDIGQEKFHNMSPMTRGNIY